MCGFLLCYSMGCAVQTYVSLESSLSSLPEERNKTPISVIVSFQF